MKADHAVTIAQGRHGGSQSGRKVESAREISITSLPFELLLSIVWSDRLEEDDVKAVRLTCRALAPAAASRLFFRIYISKLIADRDTFLAICNSPHLAQHVREVEWLEISHALGDFTNRFPAGHQEWAKTDELANLYEYMETTSKSLFWLFNTSTNPHRADFDADAIAAMRRNSVAVFRPVFEAAINKLTNLQTFVSRPMTSERVLSDLEYPIPAWQFQSFQAETPMRPETNDGLFLFLLPAMDQPMSTVTRLRWHDEFPGLSIFRSFPDSAFKGLESLDMSIKQWFTTRRPNDKTLAGLEKALMNAAPSLRHFKLIMDDMTEFQGLSLGPRVGGTIARWLSNGHFALRSLSLCSVALSPSAFLTLLKANATSLRHLSVENIPVFARVIRDTARIQGLRLESMQIIRDEELVYGEGPWWLNPDDSEDYVAELEDEQISNDGSSVNGDGIRLRKEVVTEAALLRYLRGETPASDDDRRVHEAMNADIPVLISTIPRNEATMEDHCASETYSEDSVEYRRRTAPKWAWGRYFHLPSPKNKGQVFAFPVPDETAHGHRTERWRFTSRDGTVAYGDDPLEWFEDWDLEAGDREEPLPYCTALSKFANLKTKIRTADLGEYLGEQSGAWELVKQLLPPEGAIQYDSDEDLESTPK